MHTRLLLVVAGLIGGFAPLSAQTFSAGQPFDSAQLDQLLSPIALYPDPLLGAMLPASTRPDEIAAAAGFVSANVDPTQIEQQPWDDSVKAVAHYPTVVQWMAQNAEWTNEVGAAVAEEEPAVFDSIQRLRANARASGLLVDTPQQQVVVQNNVIAIVPAQPDTVYIPDYDPQYVETRSRPVTGIRFSVGYPVGSWPLFGVDWRAHSVWIDRDRNRGRDWSRIAATPPRTREVWRPTHAAAPERFTANHFQAPSRREQVTRPTRFSDHSRRESPGITPTGRISSPAMEYATPAQNRVSTPHAAPARPGTVRTYQRPGTGEHDRNGDDNRRDPRRDDHDRRNGDQAPDR